LNCSLEKQTDSSLVDPFLCDTSGHSLVVVLSDPGRGRKEGRKKEYNVFSGEKNEQDITHHGQ